MKWRTSVLYLLVLFLVSGYLYYFEIVRKEQKEAAEKESRRVFAFQPETVKRIDIRAGDGKLVRLEKTERWQISEPVRADVDETAFDAFLGGLYNLEKERTLGPVSENPAAYGLKNPLLTIRLEAGDRWLALDVGEANPAGDARYAKLDEGGDVFLISRRSWEALNKNATDLRKKDLFSWQPEQVAAIDVSWRGGEKVRIERREGKWSVAGRPELEIRAGKVDDLLNEIHWLRATDFLDAGETPGPLVLELALHLKDGQTSRLALGQPDQKTNQAVATCSGLSTPVKVPTNFLRDVPKSADALEDRSLLAVAPEEIARVEWKRDKTGGNLVRLDTGSWEAKQGEAPPKPIEDASAVRNLLWDLAEVEYTGKSESDLPEEPSRRVEFQGKDGTSGAIAWEKPPASGGPVPVRLEKNGRTLFVTLGPKALRDLEGNLEKLAAVARD